MGEMQNHAADAEAIPSTTLDALVVGAGFSGIYSCYRLRNLNLTFACIDSASDVGGTWYWNTYPGAMSDSHSPLYRFSFDEEDFKTYPYTHNYVTQPEILSYLHHVVEKHDLRQYMQFETEMQSAAFDEKLNLWRVTTNNGRTDGLLSQPVYPDISGLTDFDGELVHTAAWRDEVSLSDKQVALIGNGSTGVQVTTKIASQVASLTCFIRHPQYVVPAGYRECTAGERGKINSDCSGYLSKVRKTGLALGFDESKRSFASATPQERKDTFEKLWSDGNGFWFLLGGFNDVASNLEANDFAAEFIRCKIASIVKDPIKARILTPHDHYARRPLCGNHYYEQFNRENVSLVDAAETPITSVTARGIVTADDMERDFDVIILATGFDALDGNYTRLHIVGRGGETIKEHWSENITSFAGIMLPKFPNFFMVLGPQSPFANNPPLIQFQVETIMAAIERSEGLRRGGETRGMVEAAAAAEQDWNRRCEDSVEGTLWKTTSSWIFGANVPGKPVATRFFFGGLHTYREFVESSMQQGWKGVTFV